VGYAEINIKDFKIVHSIDGNQFDLIVQKTATGSNSSYLHIHTQAPGETNYYPLKIIEEEGSYFYSFIVRVDLEGSPRLLNF
jgi:hypothetical protein